MPVEVSDPWQAWVLPSHPTLWVAPELDVFSVSHPLKCSLPSKPGGAPRRPQPWPHLPFYSHHPSRASSPPPLTSRLKEFCSKAGSPEDPTLKCGRKPQMQSPPSRGSASYTVLPPSVQKGAVGAWKKQVTRKLPPPRAKCQCTDIHTLSSVGYMAGPPPIPRVAYGKDEVPWGHWQNTTEGT